MRAMVLILLGLVLCGPAMAKDLTSRLGVGYSDQFGIQGSLPSLAIRYYPSPDLALGAALGVDTLKDQSKFGFMAKVMRIIFQEDNMNFYLGAAAGLISQEQVGDNDSGFDLSGYG